MLDRSCFPLKIAAGGMKEHNCVSFAQFVKYPTESWISRVNTMGVCQNLESHCTQVVKSVINLSKGTFDIWERKRGEELEMLLVFGANL
jgi:hypothetical protein